MALDQEEEIHQLLKKTPMNELEYYIRQKRLEWSSSIKNRKIVYLDINFWIRLRNENSKTEIGDRPFLNKVIELSESKKCIFPISEITFWEIMKQEDISSRNETIKLVDRFSEGFSLITSDERFRLEFRCWYLTLLGKEIYDISELVWSKASVTLLYGLIPFPPDINLQINFFDFISQLSVLKIVSESNFHHSFKDNVIEVNKKIREHKHENKTFQEVILSELGGFIDLHKEKIKEVIQDISATKIEGISTEINYHTLVYRSFELGKLQNELPVFHIMPLLFAWSRWTNKEFKDGNDTMDFLHASFALPYCDYFFTDRRLWAGITQTKLDSLYNCTVEHKFDEVMNRLSEI